MNDDGFCREGYVMSFPSVFVGAFSVDVACAIHGRHLHRLAYKARDDSPHALFADMVFRIGVVNGVFSVIRRSCCAEPYVSYVFFRLPLQLVD